MKRSPAITPLTTRLASLSEPLRLRLCRVLEREELSVGEVARVVQMPQSTVSRHLKILSDAGWLVRRAEGTATMYSLRRDDLEPRARDLWFAIQADLDEDRAQYEADVRRIEGVLAERRTDPLSFFGRVSGEWDELRNDLFGIGFSDRALHALLPPEWVVADIGCGTGNGAERIAPFVRRVIAIDQSEPMLDAARRRLIRFDNVEFRCGSAEDLPMGDACADATMGILLLHYLPDPGAALREMRRVLRPGGKALIVDMFEHDRTIYKNTMGHEHLGFGRGQMESLLRSAGFGDVRINALECASGARGPGLFVCVATRTETS